MRRRSGMSLVEVMVALVVFLPMFVALTQALGIIFEISTKAAQRGERLHRYSQLYHYFNRDIMRAQGQIYVNAESLSYWTENPPGSGTLERIVWGTTPGNRVNRAVYNASNFPVQGPSLFMDDCKMKFYDTTVGADSGFFISVYDTGLSDFKVSWTFTEHAVPNPVTIKYGPGAYQD